MAVISVEPIYECLALHKLLPECQKVGWNDFWNTDSWDYVVESKLGRELIAAVSLHNDGKRLYVELHCRERGDMDRCLEAARFYEVNEVTHTSDMHARITFKGSHDEALGTARKVITVACEVLAGLGYQPGPLHGTSKSALGGKADVV
jgi:hypothetical protein